MVVCDLDDSVVNELRSIRTSKTAFRINGTVIDRPSDVDLVGAALPVLRDALRPCIDRVEFLDGNDEAFLDVLEQPLWSEEGEADYDGAADAFSGLGLARSIVDVARVLDGWRGVLRSSAISSSWDVSEAALDERAREVD